MSVAWFVSANSQQFGPYTHDQMRDFVAQKRVGEQSLVRMGDAGEFIAAIKHAALTRLFEVEDPTSSATHKSSAKLTPVAQPLADELTSNFVVVADLKSGSYVKFEEELKKLGRSFRINRLVWMLQTERSAGSVKSALAPHIGAEDPLLIIDAGRNRMAWHNFGVFEASSMRDLWKLPHERG